MGELKELQNAYPDLYQSETKVFDGFAKARKESQLAIILKLIYSLTQIGFTDMNNIDMIEGYFNIYNHADNLEKQQAESKRKSK